MASSRLQELSWDVAEVALQRLRLALLPLGAFTKEHGLHLPLGTDAITAEYLAAAVAERVELILLPTVGYGYYPAFAEYPGSVSLRASAFRDTVVDIGLSLARHGLRGLYVLNTGVSTLGPLGEARAELAREAPELHFAYSRCDQGTEALRAELETQERGTHADELETSVLLHIAPQRVRMERAAPAATPERGPGGLTRDPAAKTGVYSPTGAWGDPTRASAGKGRALVEAHLASLVEAVDQLARSVRDGAA